MSTLTIDTLSLQTPKLIPSSFCEINKWVIIAIGLVAFAAIAHAVTGGLLYYFNVNAIASYSLFGAAGALAIATLIVGVVLFIRYKRNQEPLLLPSFTIIDDKKDLLLDPAQISHTFSTTAAPSYVLKGSHGSHIETEEEFEESEHMNVSKFSDSELSLNDDDNSYESHSISQTEKKKGFGHPDATIREAMPFTNSILKDKNPYPPLLVLMKKRLNVQWAPKFPKLKSTPLQMPKDFPLANQAKKSLIKLSYPVNVLGHMAREFSKQTASYAKQIINGECPSLAIEAEGMSHPSQLKIVYEFCHERISNFNRILIKENLKPLFDKGQEAFFFEDFFRQFKVLDSVIDFWKYLWDLAQKPFLSQEECSGLDDAIQILTNDTSDFFIEYPMVFHRLKEIMPLLSTKLALADREQIINIRQKFHAIFKIPFFLSSPQMIYLDYAGRFVEELQDDVISLLPTNDPAGDNILNADQFEEITRYFYDEIDTFNQATQIWLDENAHFDIGFDLLNSHTLFNAFFADFSHLIRTRKMIEDMLKGDSLDNKIQILKEIFQAFPCQEDEVWKKYPAMKKEMEKMLLTFLENPFAEYKFMFNNSSDVIKKDTILQTCALLAQKLEVDFKPMVEMEDGNDALYMLAESSLEIYHAQRAHGFDENSAAQMGAQPIKDHFKQHPQEKEKQLDTLLTIFNNKSEKQVAERICEYILLN